jgi:hypothetical protein
VEYRKLMVSCAELGKIIHCHCQPSQEGKVGSTVGRDCANSRCQLHAALGLARTLDVVS